MGRKYSVVLPLFGRYEVLTQQLQRKAEQLKCLGKDVEVILVVDGPQWAAAPTVQLLPYSVKSMRVVSFERPVDLPAKLFNAGIEASTGKYVIFSTLLGMDLCTSVNLFRQRVEQEEDSADELFAEELNIYYIRPQAARESDYFLSGALYGQCQTMDVLHIDEWCIPRQLWEQLGHFNESSWLQEEFERYAALSFLRLGRAVEVSALPNHTLSQPGCLYPFLKRVVPNRDLARRWAIYCNAVAVPNRLPERCAEQFINDLPEEERKLFCSLDRIKDTANRKIEGPHYRIFIVGGYWEYHHNQIAFFNFFENLYGSGFTTFRCGLDVITQVPELQGYDLVIFTRCRSDHSITLMEYCKENGIPSLYMIDDNWVSIAKDHPDEGKAFVPGNPNYDNFIKALGLCKSTVVYNRFLRRDVLPYANNVQMFPSSVCSSTFVCSEPRKREDSELYIGFAGSLRWDDTAFRALARLARRHKEVKIILAGIMSPEQEMLFTGLPVIRLPHMYYAEYARVMARLQPDVLVAPLEKTHTTQSKCPNKYLESAIVGAAGVYSKTEPYLSVIKHGANGYFVQGETDEAWYQCLDAVVRDIPKLRKAQQQARKDVLENYSVKKLKTQFMQKISAIIEQEDLADD